LIPIDGATGAQLELGFYRIHRTTLMGSVFLEREGILLFDCPNGFQVTERCIDEGHVGDVVLTSDIWAPWTYTREYGDFMWSVADGSHIKTFYHGIIAMLELPAR